MRTATTAAGGLLAILIATAPHLYATRAHAAPGPVPAVTGAPTAEAPAGAAPATPSATPAEASAVVPDAPKPAPKAPAAAPAPEPVRTGGAGRGPSPAPPMEIAVAAATAPLAERSGADTSWGFLLRGGYFGLPDLLANKLFRQHPKVTGYTYGAEIRYHGDGGGRGVSSVGLTVDQCVTEADGIWQSDEFDKPIAASGDITMTMATITWYWSILPSWWVHPYLGIGVGAAYLKGSYRNEENLQEAKYWIPAIHIPLGLALELGDHFQLVAEARLLNGIAAGGALQVRF